MTFWSLTNSDFPTNQTLHQFHDIDTELDLHRLWMVSIEHLQWVWHASRERLPLRTPGSVPFFGGLACALIVETSFPDSSPIKWPTEVDFYRIERFPWNICDRCGMPTGGAYPSGHLVPSPIVGLACAPIVETRFFELAMSLLDFSPQIPLGTFSILLRSRTIFYGHLVYKEKSRKHRGLF